MHKRASRASKAIAARLASERRRLGLTQTEMARAAGVGLRVQAYYEAGERSPDALYLNRIALAGADVAFIVTGNRR